MQPTLNSGSTSTSKVGLRSHLVERTRQAIERGGLFFEPARDTAYLEERFTVAVPYAFDIRRRLEAIAQPASSVEFSLLNSIREMAAFGCAVADLTYQLASRRIDHRDDVRRSLVVYVVASAIFDYACDEDRRLFSRLSQQLPETRLRLLLEARLSAETTTISGPPLLRYFWVLARELVAVASRLAQGDGDTHPGIAGALQERFVTTMIESYRAELASSSIHVQTGSREPTIWSSPVLIAYLLLQLCEDAAPTVVPRLEAAAETVGELLSLVDDVTDVEDDWASRSENRLIAMAQKNLCGGDRVQMPEMLSDEVTQPYMDEITARVKACATMPWAHELAAWLYYWLEA